MFIWFAENLWALWLTAAIIFAIVEILSLDFFCLMLAASGLLTITSTFFTDSLITQVFIFAAMSLLLLLLVRPKLIDRLHKNSPDAKTGTDALIGQQVEVLHPVSSQEGLVRLAGDTWTARTKFDGLTIPNGSLAKVTHISGATAYVEPANHSYKPLNLS